MHFLNVTKGRKTLGVSLPGNVTSFMLNHCVIVTFVGFPKYFLNEWVRFVVKLISSVYFKFVHILRVYAI